MNLILLYILTSIFCILPILIKNNLFDHLIISEINFFNVKLKYSQDLISLIKNKMFII